MRNHPTAEQLEQYRQQALAPEVFDVIHKHIISCIICGDHTNALPDAKQNYANLLSVLLPEPKDLPYHLAYEQVAAYVDRQLDEIDIQIAESHLEVCAQCRDDVQSLQAFKAERVAEPAPQSAKIDDLGLRRRWRAGYWPTPQRLKSAAAIGAAIGAIILLALILLRFKMPDRAELVRRADYADSSNRHNFHAASSHSSNQNINSNASGSRPVPPAGLHPSEGSRQIALVLNDGGRTITLDKQGEVVGLENLPRPLQQAIKSALTAQRLERPAILAALNDKPGTLLSEPGAGLPFQLVSPVGEVIQPNQPTFRWLPLIGASSYRVTVTDANLNEVAVSEPLTALAWQLSTPLRPGAIYFWQVTALKDGKSITSPVLPAPQAKFKVLDPTQAAEVRRASQRYAGAHLALGVLYARAGLLAAAEHELQLFVKANPGSRLARNLLRSVQSLKAG